MFEKNTLKPIIDNMGNKKIEVAIFAGGCFWCMEAAFDKIDGVLSIECGYTGGYLENPTYEQVCYGHSGHYEAIKIIFNAQKISYEKLLEIFWTNIDPTDKEGQFCDTGNQYKTAIFYTNKEQKIAAERSKRKVEQSGVFNKPITTLILPAQKFYKAEEYHQKYYKKCPQDYAIYHNLSGRASFGKKWLKLRDFFKTYSTQR